MEKIKITYTNTNRPPNWVLSNQTPPVAVEKWYQTQILKPLQPANKESALPIYQRR